MVLYATILPSASRPGAARPIEAAGIDPRQHPILAEHYGTEPLRPIGEVAAEVVADLRFRRKVIRLHRQGREGLGEYLAELGVERGIAIIIEQKLATYAEIEPEVLEAAGGDNFWQPPLHGVER